MDRPRVIGVYLAAGKSTRMGTNKLELPLGGEMLGSRAFQAALDSNIDFMLAVTTQSGPQHWLAPFSKKTGWKQVICENAEKGQSESLKTGVREAVVIGAKAVVILLADQPLIDHSVLNLLIEEFQKSDGLSIVSAAVGGMCKPPVLFPQHFFPALLKLEGDEGGRQLLRNAEDVRKIAFPSFYFRDADTIEDYHDLLRGERVENRREECDSERSVGKGDRPVTLYE